ncbi:hypothetical protein CDO28_34370 (plasmid) [Sinorhizobium meliloti]|uniref:chorismate mutase n=1 Tax=Rhizobium meliloti TaxID=382 RepID=UPI000B49C182|nr:chorismate mutase [Sinorhizobium meliloti]ASP76463.1 hypothetical protein CDO28_34370 [Sinorhizobium meliloti]MDE3857069.1 chorismate mutase [Sinorhizobium meliloti]MQW48107.1 hypothetical protein [Sinorhizobium meliloti]
MDASIDLEELGRLRAQLDELDHQLLSLLARRFEIIRSVAQLKRTTDISVQQPERVKEMLAVRRKVAESLSIDPQFVSRLFRAIVDEACKIENSIIGNRSAVLQNQAVRIDHVAIAVENLEHAVHFYEKMLGFQTVERWSIEGSFSGMNAAVIEAGNVSFVLVEGRSPTSNVCRYIKAFGPGVQHIAIEVDDIDAAFSDLESRGFAFIGGIYDFGGLKQIFSRRDANSGIQIEIISRGSSARFEKGNVQRLFEIMEREDVF